MRKRAFAAMILSGAAITMVGCGTQAPISSQAPKSSSRTRGASLSLRTRYTSFDPVVTQAFRDIQTKTKAPIGGPTRLPPVKVGYLTALTSATNNSWLLQLLETEKPCPVNSPSILKYNIAGGTASWGEIALPSVPGDIMQNLKDDNNLWLSSARLLTASANTPHKAVRISISKYKYPAKLIPVGGNQWMNTRLIWTEGKWTVAIIDSNAKSEEQAANIIANELHDQELPPHPGLMVVFMAVPASRQTVALGAVTSLDWLDGSTVYHVFASSSSSNNPQQAIAMAASWVPWAGRRIRQ